MINYIKKIKKDREQVKIDEAPIIMTEEYLKFFDSFESISKDSKRHNLFGLRTKIDLGKCCICFSTLTKKNVIAKFDC